MSDCRTQSRKRNRSGSASLDKAPENISEMILPPQELIAPTRAGEIMYSFRAAVMISAVTGMGRHWCPGLHIGPAIQACHIVPQQNFHVYPTGDDLQDTEFSGQHILQAWLDTWDPQNGLPLRCDIRELFDARLISIHPDTHRIRAFVPYDVILNYHGHIAIIPRIVDHDALAHHYEMTCTENMAAEMPICASTTFPSTTDAGTSAPPNSPS